MKATLKHLVSNRSSREGANPVLAVLHTTEGPGINLEGLAEFFDRPSTQASSHIANNAVGESIRMVPDDEKAWTCAGYNRYSLNIEQMAFASTSKRDWFLRHDKQLSNTAAWLAVWNVLHHIPLRKGIALGNTVSIVRSGVVQHKNLGIIGGGHSDCGDGYPQRYVVRLAKLIVEEHHLGRPHSRKANYLRRLVNRQRRRFNLEPFTAPRK